MLTKKVYKRVAKIIGNSCSMEEIIEEFITFFRDDNNLFDDDKFRREIERIATLSPGEDKNDM